MQPAFCLGDLAFAAGAKQQFSLNLRIGRGRHRKICCRWFHFHRYHLLWTCDSPLSCLSPAPYPGTPEPLPQMWHGSRSAAIRKAVDSYRGGFVRPGLPKAMPAMPTHSRMDSASRSSSWLFRSGDIPLGKPEGADKPGIAGHLFAIVASSGNNYLPHTARCLPRGFLPRDDPLWPSWYSPRVHRSRRKRRNRTAHRYWHQW